jgi:osmotically inducible lipoprotein OsmB
MRAALKAGLVMLSFLTLPGAVYAGTLEGAGIGAGTGAVIAGPPGAVIGAIVGGPNIIRRERRRGRDERRCWRDDNGHRHCSWR